MNKIALIVCTKDRRFDLKRLLGSVAKSSRLPDLVIIVDGSDNPIKDVVDRFTSLNIDYVTVRPPSLPKQRNVGISRIPKDIDWVGFLDDDLELMSDSIEKIEDAIANFKTSKQIGGLSMIINNISNVPYSFLHTLQLLDNPKSGIVNKAACPVYLRQTDENEEVEWVSGGTTFWKREVFYQFSYDEWFEGTGYFEDVDFSYNVSRKYSLVLCGPSKCNHFQHPVSRKKNYPLGIWQITAWWYFVRKMNNFHFPSVLYAMFCVTMNNLLMGILKFNIDRIVKFFGNISGFGLIFTGKALKQRVFHK